MHPSGEPRLGGQPRPETNKKDLEDFINDHYRLIASIGVFGALTAYLDKLGGFGDLASITLIIFLFLTGVLLDKFPDAANSSLKLLSFSLLVGVLLIGVAIFILVTYVTKYYKLFIFAFSLGIYALAASKISQQSRLFERLKNRIGKKHYENAQMLVLIGIILLVFLLGTYTTNLIVGWINITT